MPSGTGTFAICLLFGLMSSAAPAADSPLVPYVIRDGGIAAPLTTSPGNVDRGQAVAIDREGGNCLGCHALPVAAEFAGTTGPDLAGIGARRSVPELRLRMVDAKALNPATIMPAYYRVAGLNRVLHAYVGKPILTAQQIEDVVAFLATLK